jgi:hypothetical protein
MNSTPAARPHHISIRGTGTPPQAAYFSESGRTGTAIPGLLMVAFGGSERADKLIFLGFLQADDGARSKSPDFAPPPDGA